MEEKIKYQLTSEILNLMSKNTRTKVYQPKHQIKMTNTEFRHRFHQYDESYVPKHKIKK